MGSKKLIFLYNGCFSSLRNPSCRVVSTLSILLLFFYIIIPLCGNRSWELDVGGTSSFLPWFHSYPNVVAVSRKKGGVFRGMHGEVGGLISTSEESGSLDDGETFGMGGKRRDLWNGKGSVKNPEVEEEEVQGNEFVASAGGWENCDFFDGRWVWDDERKPYYRPGSCTSFDLSFNCHRNGRRDYDYLKWRWQPHGCNIPRLNASDFLERLRGQRLVFVGDSLNRNMWESLVCILREGLGRSKNGRSFEIRGTKKFKYRGYSLKLKDYDCLIDFVKAPFLVKEVYRKESRGKISARLRLDLLDGSSWTYRTANVIIFNSGHWWRDEKTGGGMNYFEEGNKLHRFLTPMEGYGKGMKTWARWVDKNIDMNRSQIFFRGLSCEHFRGGKWNSGGRCYNETEPIMEEEEEEEASGDEYRKRYVQIMATVEKTLRGMRTPVTYLNVSRMTKYRKDGHPSIYRRKKRAIDLEERLKVQDCSHWCLPGIPDTWNELLYASLLKNGRGAWRI